MLILTVSAGGAGVLVLKVSAGGAGVLVLTVSAGGVGVFGNGVSCESEPPLQTVRLVLTGRDAHGLMVIMSENLRNKKITAGHVVPTFTRQSDDWGFSIRTKKDLKKNENQRNPSKYRCSDRVRSSLGVALTLLWWMTSYSQSAEIVHQRSPLEFQIILTALPTATQL